ncbi:hypothetical protein QM620_19945 [Rhodococcus sp. IEGM 1251]|uniref:hypothetical protein n=2 Tax=unclassified Rhodococcus (in: high G+C Gram-positive bacteria) TaxID=192944 RepID=UPI0024B828DE|nr:MULTISPECIES: hypothetical protein [unclassified Rhodococcus (in: high G+C Gram-positive bacteria)]MDI9964782.1 hypothetical protein [Rhodococcus sp. IEGM 1251]MDV8127113.1 hypothetical protein [Rhodococcus sp. IEGM 1304]
MAARTERQRRIAEARKATMADPWFQLVDEALQDRRRRARLRGSAYIDEDCRTKHTAVARREARREVARAAILERYSADGATEALADEASATEGSA